MSLQSLEEKLLIAHSANDKSTLVGLYRQAGDIMLSRDDIDAACFYLTHAYIFALDVGHQSTSEIHQILVAHGREE